MTRVYDADVEPVDARVIALLEALERAAPDPGPVPLSEDYLRAVERAEALPGNRAGMDKSWVERSRREFRDYFTRVQRVRPAP